MVIEKYYFPHSKPKYKIVITKYKGTHTKLGGLFIYFGKYIIGVYL